MSDDYTPDVRIPETGDKWVWRTWVRDASTTSRVTVYGDEIIDGVLFMSALHYGPDGRLEHKVLTRADLIVG